MARPGIHHHAPTATCTAGFAPEYMLLKLDTILPMRTAITTGMETIKVLTGQVEIVHIARHITDLQGRRH